MVSARLEKSQARVFLNGIAVAFNALLLDVVWIPDIAPYLADFFIT